MATLIPHTWNVPQRFRERLGHQVGRQRAMLDQGHLLLVLHAPPDPDEPQRRDGCFFWRLPDGAWRSAPAPGGQAALRAHLDAFGRAARDLEERIEGADQAEEWFQALRVASPLARAARHLHAALQAAREALPEDRELIALRDQAGDVERAAELLQELAREGLEFTIARRSEEQAVQGEAMLVASHRLNVLAAVFLPMTALAGVMGMNLKSGLEDVRSPWLFWGVILVSLALGWLIRSGLPDPRQAGPRPQLA